MSRWNLGWLIGITAAALLGVSITYSAPPPVSRNQRDLKLVSDVLDEVRKRYVKKLDQDKMRELVENMINGGLRKLDPHSGFLGEKEYKNFHEQSVGKFGGAAGDWRPACNAAMAVEAGDNTGTAILLKTYFRPYAALDRTTDFLIVDRAGEGENLIVERLAQPLEVLRLY